MRSAIAIGLLVACDSGGTKQTPAPVPPPVAVVLDATVPRSCEDVRPEHEAVERARREAFAKALADQGLTPLAIDSLDEIWQPMPAPTGEWPPELSATVITHKGKRRDAIVTRVHDWAALGRTFELGVDAQGNVFQLIPQLVPAEVKHITVDACQWGCFGVVPSGDDPGEKIGRYAWLLPKGNTFKGERRIEYRAPRIEWTTTKQCAPPA